MSQQIEFSVDKKIFEKFPEYRRAVLVVTDADNAAASQLSAKIEGLAKDIKAHVTLDDPRIAAWKDAFALLGIKVRDFKPSIDALVRRILNDKPLGSISPVVDVGTIISLQFVLPAGAHPILTDTTKVELKLAGGEETEPSDGTHPSETVPVNELILVDTGRVATRRWVWRQTSQSRIDQNTKNFFLNIDALDVIDEKTLNEAIKSSKEIIEQTFNRDTEVIILSSNNPFQTVKIK